jgi:hypothetical protein
VTFSGIAAFAYTNLGLTKVTIKIDELQVEQNECSDECYLVLSWHIQSPERWKTETIIGNFSSVPISMLNPDIQSGDEFCFRFRECSWPLLPPARDLYEKIVDEIFFEKQTSEFEGMRQHLRNCLYQMHSDALLRRD